MSPDIDELLRTTMRRHASDAPTRIDLDAVRARSHAITQRRRFEAVAAVVTTLVVLLGLGYAASQLRTQATPVGPSPTAKPDGLPWIAFPRFDPNGLPTGTTSIVLRVDGVERAVAQPDRGAAVLGWYGDGRGTLVYTQGGEGVRESPLMTVTVSDDGTRDSTPTALQIAGAGALTGRAYAVPGSGPVLWRPDATLRRGDLVRVSADLRSATVVPLPAGEPLFVTADTLGLGSAESDRIQLVSTTTGAVSGSFTVCLPFSAVATKADGSHVAIACGDGTVQLVNLGGATNPRLAAVPDGSGRGGFLGLWFDAGDGLHASTTPSLQSGYSEVNDYDYNGVSWDAAGTDVITRQFPAPGSTVDLAYHAQKWAFTAHWVVTHPHEIDLGETTGAGIAFREP